MSKVIQLGKWSSFDLNPRLTVPQYTPGFKDACKEWSWGRKRGRSRWDGGQLALTRLRGGCLRGCDRCTEENEKGVRNSGDRMIRRKKVKTFFKKRKKREKVKKLRRKREEKAKGENAW